MNIGDICCRENSGQVKNCGFAGESEVF